MDHSEPVPAWLTAQGRPEPARGQGGGRRWASLVLDPQASSVSEARRWARDVLDGWDAGDQEWTMSQLLTEVVTNALLHAGTRFEVRLEQDVASGRLLCAVTDASPARPRRRRHTVDAATGRGLALVAQLSRRWGVQPAGPGKAVWFEVDAAADLGIGDGMSAEAWLAEADAGRQESPRGRGAVAHTDRTAA